MYDRPPFPPGAQFPYGPAAYSESMIQGRSSRPLGRPAHILFLHPSDEVYGSDLAFLNIVRGLDRRHFSPYVVLANDLNFGGLLSRELDEVGIPHHATALAVSRGRYATPSGRLELRKRRHESTAEISQLVRDEEIDLIYSNTLSLSTGALVARNTGRPHVWHVHEIAQRAKLRRFVPRHASRVICTSRAALDALLTDDDARRKGTVIYNGLPAAEWTGGYGREAVRAELGCGPYDVLFGMMGRLAASKAPDLFVEAAAHMVGRYANVHFFVAGGVMSPTSRTLARVRKLIADSVAPQRIHLLGYRRDTPALMAALDVLVQPSRQPESCNMAILQAMFSGKPVLAANSGGTPELVNHDETGLLIPPEDAATLALTMEMLLREPARRQRYGVAGQQRGRAYFTVEQQLGLVNELLYEEVARARGGG